MSRRARSGERQSVCVERVPGWRSDTGGQGVGVVAGDWQARPVAPAWRTHLWGCCLCFALGLLFAMSEAQQGV